MDIQGQLKRRALAGWKKGKVSLFEEDRAKNEYMVSICPIDHLNDSLLYLAVLPDCIYKELLGICWKMGLLL